MGRWCFQNASHQGRMVDHPPKQIHQGSDGVPICHGPTGVSDATEKRPAPATCPESDYAVGVVRTYFSDDLMAKQKMVPIIFAASPAVTKIMPPAMKLVTE